MSTQQITPAAASAREAARTAGGQFGTQPLAEADLVLPFVPPALHPNHQEHRDLLQLSMERALHTHDVEAHLCDSALSMIGSRVRIDFPEAAVLVVDPSWGEVCIEDADGRLISEPSSADPDAEPVNLLNSPHRPDYYTPKAELVLRSPALLRNQTEATRDDDESNVYRVSVADIARFDQSLKRDQQTLEIVKARQVEADNALSAFAMRSARVNLRDQYPAATHLKVYRTTDTNGTATSFHVLGPGFSYELDAEETMERTGVDGVDQSAILRHATWGDLSSFLDEDTTAGTVRFPKCEDWRIDLDRAIATIPTNEQEQ